MLDARISRRTGAAFVLSLTLAVVACGGGDEAGTGSPQAGAPLAATLLDDDGSPMPSDPAALPAGFAAFGADRRYATAAQADDLRRALGSAARTVEVACCGEAAVERAVRAALGPDGGPPLAVFIDARDPDLGAATADRLRAGGLDRVWLVSP